MVAKGRDITGQGRMPCERRSSERLLGHDKGISSSEHIQSVAKNDTSQAIAFVFVVEYEAQEEPARVALEGLDRVGEDFGVVEDRLAVGAASVGTWP